MKKPKALAGVRPNAGLEAAYKRKLQRLIDDMYASIIYWVKAAYRQNAPEIAQDASPAKELQSTMDRLAKRWRKRINAEREPLAQWFAQSVSERSDSSLMASLKRAGIAIEFRMTDAQRDVLNACTLQNVSLITKLTDDAIRDVEGIVMRAVAKGGDLKQLSDELIERHGIARRRAQLIARDQSSKTNADLTRARYLQLGVKKAIWKHSHGGKEPRKSHLEFDGHEFDIEKGAYLDGEWLQPGEAINCRCFAKPLLPELGDDE